MPQQIIAMGVSGVGKSTIAIGVAEALGWDFTEGDDLHPAENVEKMRAGIPLTDDDRWPWLRQIGERMNEQIAAGRSTVITCSALKRSYRDLLRENRPSVRFLHLVADPDVIAIRMQHRPGHFMPAALLQSQLETLETLAPDEPGVEVPVIGEPDEVVQRSLRALDLTEPEGKSLR